MATAGGTPVRFGGHGAFLLGFGNVTVNWATTGPAVPTSPQQIAFNLGTQPPGLYQDTVTVSVAY